MSPEHRRIHRDSQNTEEVEKVKRILLALLICLSLCPEASAVWVTNYHREDGRLVHAYLRSRADEWRWNNFGRPGPHQHVTTPNEERDFDADAIPNYRDLDDDNDGINDDNDNQ